MYYLLSKDVETWDVDSLQVRRCPTRLAQTSTVFEHVHGSCTILSGTSSSLLIEILAGTHVGLYSLFINRDSGIGNSWSMHAEDQNTQQQKNGTTADRWENSYSPEESAENNRRIEMQQSQPTFVIYINDVLQSVDLIACRKLAVSSRNVAIYTPNEYIVRQTITTLLLHLARWITTRFSLTLTFTLSWDFIRRCVNRVM